MGTARDSQGYGGIMKKSIIAVCLLFSFALSAEIVESIVAKVNDEIITMHDVRAKMSDVRVEYRRLKKGLPRDLKKTALDLLINDILVMQKAKKDGVVVSRLEIEDRISKMLQTQKLTLEQFKKKLITEGQNYEQLFSEMRKRLIIQKLFRKSISDTSGGIKLKDEEVLAFYETLKKTNPLHLTSYHIQHIYIYLNPGADFSTRLTVEKRIEKARTQVKAGWALPLVARSNGARFKDFGFVKISPDLPKYLYPVFDKNMYVGKYKDFKIVNEIPGVPGYHAVKVVGAKPIDFEDVKDRIRQLLMEKKMAESMEDWVKNLRKEARIVFNS